MGFGFRAVSMSVVAAALVSASAPAFARDYRGNRGHHYRHHDRGIGTVGGIVLGAAVLGGIAAIASSNRREREARDYYRDGYTPYQGAQGSHTQDGYAGVDPRAVPPPSAYDGPVATDDEPNGYRDQSASGDPVDDCARAAERRAQNDGGFARVTRIGRVTEIDGGAEVQGELEIDRGRGIPAGRLRFSCAASFGEITRLRLG